MARGMARRVRSQRFRELVFLVVGMSTPIGILAVNGSAFVMQHLHEFRVGIAICALVSGLSLNGLTAWALFGRVERRVPQLVAEYRTWIITAATIVVVGFSIFGAYGTYLSMQDPRLLPNVYAVLTAIWLLVLPVLMTFVARRVKIGVKPEPAKRRVDATAPEA